jgi:hypothetical protein
MTRDQHYLNRLAHYLGEGLDLPAARDMAAIVTASLYHDRPDQVEVQADWNDAEGWAPWPSA